MTDLSRLAETRARLSLAGVMNADVAWFAAIGWSDANVPALQSAQGAADYERREKMLNAAIADLPLPDRIMAIESKLAAALGARLADWRERGDED